MKKVLFVCSQNRMRSLTAEKLFAGCPGYAVRSAGTEESARTPVSQEHVQWADTIFVMEYDHVQRLEERFGDVLRKKKVISLGIPDIYNFMEPALIEELRAKLGEHIEMPG